MLPATEDSSLFPLGVGLILERECVSSCVNGRIRPHGGCEPLRIIGERVVTLTFASWNLVLDD